MNRKQVWKKSHLSYLPHVDEYYYYCSLVRLRRDPLVTDITGNLFEEDVEHFGGGDVGIGKFDGNRICCIVSEFCIH